MTSRIALTKQYENGRKDCDRYRISRFPHCSVDYGNGNSSHDGAETSHSYIWHLFISSGCANNQRATTSSAGTHRSSNIIISNRIKAKLSPESDQVPRQTVQHLGKRRVYIKVVLPSQVLARKGSKVDLVEDDLIRVVDPVESDREGENGNRSGCGP